MDGTVSGAVFQDFGSTGIYTIGDAAAGVPRNRPIADVTATAYDADGDAVGTATSAADGTYTIDVTDARSQDLRIEFSGWDPEIYQPGFAVQTAVPADALGSSDTSVQFVTLGTDDADHVDLALIIPDQVIQANAPISTAIQYAGDPLNPANALTDSDAVVAQPWADFGAYEDPDWPFGRVTLATFQQVGSVWGTSYIRNGNRMLVTPTVKRMSGLGPGGLGAIYQINDVLLPDGSINTGTPDPEVWFDVEDLNEVGGGPQIDLGDIPVNGTGGRGLGNHDTPATDITAFSGAARIGIGGMTTSLDGRAMFVTNLRDKSIYGINIDDPDITPTVAVPFATPVGPGQQLWAVTTYQNRLYLGFVDTGPRPGLVRRRCRDERLCRLDGGRQHGRRGRQGDPPDASLAARADCRPRLRQGLQHGGLADPKHGDPADAQHLPRKQYDRAEHGRLVPAAHPMEQLDRQLGPGTPPALPSPQTTRSTWRFRPAAAPSVCRAGAATARAGNRSTRSRCSPVSRSTSTGT